MHFAEELLRTIISWGVLFFEYIGVVILILSGIHAVIGIFKRSPHIRLDLARGMATALSFKLGGEILRTVVVQTFHEIAIVACIVALRAALTFLIHWEIGHMEREEAHLSSREK